jgi:dTDP-4-amino-4,6-dideoxygalactose transaminase
MPHRGRHHAPTRAFLVVHYGGVGCEMLPIMRLAERHGLVVIEDAAHAFGGRYRGRPLGGIGHLAALSFHETKNVMAGEGGALVINDSRWNERAEIIWEKGTDRMRFARGEIAKYTWIDIGSSFLPSEITAAVLWGQLEARTSIQAARWAVWRRYDAALRPLADDRAFGIPHIPAHCEANAHLYYVVLPSEQERDALIADAARRGVQMVIHYVPLHLSQAGRRFGRVHGHLQTTEHVAARLVRLPLWIGLDTAATDTVLGCFPMLRPA